MQRSYPVRMRGHMQRKCDVAIILLLLITRMILPPRPVFVQPHDKMQSKSRGKINSTSTSSLFILPKYLSRSCNVFSRRAIHRDNHLCNDTRQRHSSHRINKIRRAPLIIVCLCNLFTFETPISSCNTLSTNVEVTTKASRYLSHDNNAIRKTNA